MRTGLESIRDVSGTDPLVHAVRRFDDEWREGVPDIRRHLVELPGIGPVALLAALVKSDIRNRFARGERVAVADYLERFPALRADKERVVSLVYEEFCLREERGEKPDPGAFCEQYSPWKDSLASQLRYHRVLSEVAGPALCRPKFPEPGERFAEFRIGTEIGRGGAARVYLAEQTDMGNRTVALKVSADRGSEPSILGRLKHAHIIPVLTSARPPESRLLGLCMEYMPGLPLDEVIGVVKPAERPRQARALRDVLNAGPTPPPTGPDGAEVTPPRSGRGGGKAGWAGFPLRGRYADGVAWVVKTLAEALAYAHARGVLHLDVKPANVLLTHEGGPQLLDFNLSQDPHTAEQAEAALRGGTLPYMAPEQLEAFLDESRWGDVTAAADVYSLGLLACEMISGRPPEAQDLSLPRARAIQGLLDRRRDLRVDLRRDNPAVPHALQAILAKCVAFHPAERYASAAELAGDLNRFLKRRPLLVAENDSRRERAAYWLKRNALALSAVAALAVGAGVAVQSAAREKERNAAFAEYDASHFEAAGRAFRGVETYDGSPLIRFYRAACDAWLKREREALPPIVKILRSAGESEDLVARGRKHPSFPRHVEELAVGFLGSYRSDALPDDVKPSFLDTAEALARLSLKVDPKRDLARFALANVAEIRGDFNEADRILGVLVAEAASGHSPDHPAKFLSASFARARSLTSWAQAISSDEDADARELDDGACYAARAIDDLDRLEARFVSLRAELAFRLKYVRVQATLALADIARRRGRDDEALGLERKAKTICDDTPANGASERHFKELLRQVNDRLALDDREPLPAARARPVISFPSPR